MFDRKMGNGVSEQENSNQQSSNLEAIEESDDKGDEDKLDAESISDPSFGKDVTVEELADRVFEGSVVGVEAKKFFFLRAFTDHKKYFGNKEYSLL